MERKLWGLFSGAQLTVMFVSVMAVAVPGTLWAVAASNVAITDTATGKTAAVNSTRRLYVTDSLLDQGVTPASFVHGSRSGSAGSGCQTLAAPPSGKALVAREVKVDVYQNPSPGNGQFVEIFAGTTCSTPIEDVNAPSIGHFIVPFDPGFATTSGISFQVGGSVAAELYFDGYLVPAGQVPSSGLLAPVGRQLSSTQRR